MPIFLLPLGCRLRPTFKPTDRQTDRPTDRVVYREAPLLKILQCAVTPTSTEVPLPRACVDAIFFFIRYIYIYSSVRLGYVRFGYVRLG